ncbi:hypothetical protein F1880_000553 [Penicillium rolfsii]|nr:hypothetical protein F1880_000553 [Penicillium rolfsii]
MSDYNPFHDGEKGTGPWGLDFETESCPPHDSTEVTAGFFRDMIDAAGSPNSHPTVLSPNPSTPTATPSTVENTEPIQTTTSATLVNNDAESTPALGRIKQEDSEEPQRVKKRRRSRNSPEPDYSQIILELNKKRKRTGQACDRCRVRRYKCDPNRKGCFNCAAASMVCKVTDCVTGETYVRGAAGRMAAEIEALKARVADLERENEELRRNTQPRYSFEQRDPHTVPLFSSSINMRAQNHLPVTGEQEISNLRQEKNEFRQQTTMLRNNNQSPRKRVEDQESTICLDDDMTLFNTKLNWTL